MTSELIGKIWNEDCLETMRRMEDKSVDLIVTDPPYGIGRDVLHQKNEGKWGFKEYGWTNWDTPISVEYFTEMFRVSKNQIIWGANYYPQFLTPSMGWIFWYKSQPNFSFSDGEFAFTSFQKKARMYEYARGNESGFAPLGCDAPNRHPTQKPVAVMSWVVNTYSEYDALIYDPFMGSGTTAVACEKLGRRWIGSEINPNYCKIAEKRIEAVRAQGDLFQP